MKEEDWRILRWRDEGWIIKDERWEIKDERWEMKDIEWRKQDEMHTWENCYDWHNNI